MQTCKTCHNVNDSHQFYITMNLQHMKGKMSSHLPLRRNGKSLSCSSHLNLIVLWLQHTNIYVVVKINIFLFCFQHFLTLQIKQRRNRDSSNGMYATSQKNCINKMIHFKCTATVLAIPSTQTQHINSVCSFIILYYMFWPYILTIIRSKIQGQSKKKLNIWNSAPVSRRRSLATVVLCSGKFKLYFDTSHITPLQLVIELRGLEWTCV
jgi:hypothetical protein